MKRSALWEHLRKAYPRCSNRKINDLVSAIEEDKYWWVCPGKKDAVYVVALTKAQIPLKDGFQARATHVGRVRVLRSAARFSRKGRVLLAVKEGTGFVARCAITWPAFLQLMHEEPQAVYELERSGLLPPFVNEKNLPIIIARLKG